MYSYHRGNTLRVNEDGTQYWTDLEKNKRARKAAARRAAHRRDTKLYPLGSNPPKS